MLAGVAAMLGVIENPGFVGKAEKRLVVVSLAGMNGKGVASSFAELYASLSGDIDSGVSAEWNLKIRLIGLHSMWQCADVTAGILDKPIVGGSEFLWRELPCTADREVGDLRVVYNFDCSEKLHPHRCAKGEYIFSAGFKSRDRCNASAVGASPFLEEPKLGCDKNRRCGRECGKKGRCGTGIPATAAFFVAPRAAAPISAAPRATAAILATMAALRSRLRPYSLRPPVDDDDARTHEHEGRDSEGGGEHAGLAEEQGREDHAEDRVDEAEDRHA